MRTTFGELSPISERGVVSRGQLAAAGVLLVGVIVLGYGYFQQNKIGLYGGLAVTLAGALNGLVQILTRGGR